MPRYHDEWILDKVLFDYAAGGACACCNFQQFLPGGTKDLIDAVTDLESDQAVQEVEALQHHPWPADLRDQVWAERVRLRHYLKRDMKGYAEFWNQHGAAFQQWCRDEYIHAAYGFSNVKRVFQLPRQEILDTIRVQYKIHSAFGVVLCAVTDQVAYFPLTGYPADGRGEAELKFEQDLTFDRRGGFTFRSLIQSRAETTDVDEQLILESFFEMWWKRMEMLGGPKLLERGPKGASSKRNNPQSELNDSCQDKNYDDDDDADGPVPKAKSSFLGDRRIVRLLIARYWADRMKERYLAHLKKKQKFSSDTTTEETTGNTTHPGD